jgi:hypothetical protein
MKNKINMKIFFNTIIIYIITLLVASGNDKKPFTFLTSVGSTINEAHVRANNIAFMNGMKVVGRKTVKSGDTWVTTVKVVSRN